MSCSTYLLNRNGWVSFLFDIYVASNSLQRDILYTFQPIDTIDQFDVHIDKEQIKQSWSKHQSIVAYIEIQWKYNVVNGGGCMKGTSVHYLYVLQMSNENTSRAISQNGPNVRSQRHLRAIINYWHFSI